MRDIINQIMSRQNGYERIPSRFTRAMVCVLDEQHTSRPDIHPTIAFAYRHTMAVTIGVEFTANDVMLADQKILARRRVVDALYGGIEPYITEAIMAIQGGDAEAAMGALLALRKEITP